MTAPDGREAPTSAPPWAPPPPTLGYGAASRPAPLGSPFPPASPKSDAGTLSKVIAFLAIGAALASLAVGVHDSNMFVFPLVAVAAGVMIGQVADLRRIYRSFPGALAGVIALVALFAVWAFASSNSRVPVSFWPFAFVAIVVTAADWYWAERLRATVICSGLLVVPAISAKEVTALPLAVLWFLLAASTLWSIERDAVSASPHLAPIAPGAATAPDNSQTALDLARIVGIAAVAALALTLLIGHPTLSRSSGSSGSSSASGASGGVSGGASGGAAGGASGGGYGGNGPSGGAGGGYGGGAAGGASGGNSGNGPNGGFSNDPSGGVDGGQDFTNGGGGANSANGGNSGGGGASGGATGRGSSSSGLLKDVDLGPWMKGLLAGLVALALLAFVGPSIWRWANRAHEVTETNWARDLVERLEHEGRRRGRPRRPSETIREYAVALSRSELPDRRIADVGEVLSRALFGPVRPPDAVRADVIAVLDDVTAAHPPEKWTDRFHRDRDADPAPAPG